MLRQCVRGFATINQSGNNPYEFIQVKKKLNFVQYKETMMRISKQNLYQLTPEQVRQDYLVRSFFPNHSDQIEIHEAANQDLSNRAISYPRNCWHQIRLPFSKCPEMRLKFTRFYSPSLRIGRILEILDYIGVTTTYKYLYQTREEEKLATVVTACVDNMNFYAPIDANSDLIITSYASYVGSSSIEVQIDLWQDQPAKDNGFTDDGQSLKASAVFLFVARDKKDHSKSFKVPALSFDGEEDAERCNMRYQIGLKHQQKRKRESQDSLWKKAPSQEENDFVHKYFVNSIEKDGKINIRDTLMEKNLLMHTQDRNLHGKIFGGFVMREAFEIG